MTAEIEEAFRAIDRAKAMREAPGGTTAFLVVERMDDNLFFLPDAAFADRETAVVYAKDLMRQALEYPEEWEGHYIVQEIIISPASTKTDEREYGNG